MQQKERSFKELVPRALKIKYILLPTFRHI